MKNKKCLYCGKELVKWQRKHCSAKCAYYYNYYTKFNKKKKKSIFQTNKKLMQEWDYEKNKELGLDSKNISPSSHKQVYWQCSRGHRWIASINSRINISKGCNYCPYCFNRKVCIDNCLATLNPILSKEWHPTKNGGLTPNGVVAGSHKKVWWKGKCGHEWQAVVERRHNSGTGCPYCAGRKACKDNCLKTKFPEIAKEWNFIKNGKLTSSDVTYGSKKKVWWKCEKGHEWSSTPNSRTSRFTGCPYCAGQKVCNDNCLKAKFPEIAKEWHPTKNGELTPKDVTCGNRNKIWWRCKKGHEWKSSISSRAKVNGNGCPFCHKKSEGKVRDLLLKYFKDWTIIPNKKLWDKYKDYNHRRYCDFWLEKDNIKVVIEYDGECHYIPIRFGGISIPRAQENLKKIQIKDKLDEDFCKENSIILYRIKYDRDKEKSVQHLKQLLFSPS